MTTGMRKKPVEVTCEDCSKPFLVESNKVPRRCQSCTENFRREDKRERAQRDYATKWEYRAKAAAASRRNRLKRVYGITEEEYNAILAHQDGKCAICKRKPGAQRLAVDHDHGTNRIYGLLCTTCNRDLLGKCGRRAEKFRAAADYLETPPAFNVLSADRRVPPKGGA